MEGRSCPARRNSAFSDAAVVTSVRVAIPTIRYGSTFVCRDCSRKNRHTHHPAIPTATMRMPQTTQYAAGFSPSAPSARPGSAGCRSTPRPASIPPVGWLIPVTHAAIVPATRRRTARTAAAMRTMMPRLASSSPSAPPCRGVLIAASQR